MMGLLLYLPTTRFFMLFTLLMTIKLYVGIGWQFSSRYSRISGLRRSLSSSANNNIPLANLYTYPHHRTLDNFHLFSGKVHRGYGRGSKKLGFPTANLPQFEKQLNLTSLENGVYYGLGQVEGDSAVHYAVANIGYSPTFVGQENRQRIIEAYLIDYVPIVNESGSTDFYDKNLKIVFLGFLRKEMKFRSIDELKGTISQDVAITREIFEYLTAQGLLLSLREQFFPDASSIAKDLH